MPKLTTYSFGGDGKLLVKHPESGTYTISAFIVDEDFAQSERPTVPELQKGDLVLWYFNRQDVKSVYMKRYLRKIEL
jgi:hypothetical protein